MIATVQEIAIDIVIVNAVQSRGEKILSAYMMMSPFVSIVGQLVSWSVGRLFSFCSSVVNANEWGGFASSRYVVTIGASV